MGLDMYLNKKKYVGYADNTEVDVTTKDFHDEVHKSHYKNVNYICQEVGYWRKANEIHRWFVEQCCEGKDDCQEHYVSFEKLLELKKVCQDVLNAFNSNHLTDGEKQEVAEDLLPRCQGFFFGSYDYNDWYKEDLERTIKIIDDVEKEYDASYDRLYYEASW